MRIEFAHIKACVDVLLFANRVCRGQNSRSNFSAKQIQCREAIFRRIFLASKLNKAVSLLSEEIKQKKKKKRKKTQLMDTDNSMAITRGDGGGGGGRG